jgi:hypothetical protein
LLTSVGFFFTAWYDKNTPSSITMRLSRFVNLSWRVYVEELQRGLSRPLVSKSSSPISVLYHAQRRLASESYTPAIPFTFPRLSCAKTNSWSNFIEPEFNTTGS